MFEGRRHNTKDERTENQREDSEPNRHATAQVLTQRIGVVQAIITNALQGIVESISAYPGHQKVEDVQGDDKPVASVNVPR